jgi:hypothetical protein
VCPRHLTRVSLTGRSTVVLYSCNSIDAKFLTHTDTRHTERSHTPNTQHPIYTYTLIIHRTEDRTRLSVRSALLYTECTPLRHGPRTIYETVFQHGYRVHRTNQIVYYGIYVYISYGRARNIEIRITVHELQVGEGRVSSPLSSPTRRMIHLHVHLRDLLIQFLMRPLTFAACTKRSLVQQTSTPDSRLPAGLARRRS